MEEYINKVELKGRVSHLQVKKVGSQKTGACSEIATFVVTTELHYEGLGGTFVEPTSAPVAIWRTKENRSEFDSLSESSLVHITGRLRVRRLTGQDGSDRSYFDVLASTIQVIK